MRIIMPYYAKATKGYFAIDISCQTSVRADAVHYVAKAM